MARLFAGRLLQCLRHPCGTTRTRTARESGTATPPKRYSGVHVVLQTKDQAGKWTDVPGRETTTNDKGEYSFTDLHSGDYRVVLPKVERKDASTEV